MEREELSLTLGVVRTYRRLQIARVRVADSKATNGLTGGVGEMVVVGGAWVIVGAREELWVVVVAHGGMDQADSVGEDVIELSSFFNLLSVSHPLSSEQILGLYSEEKTVVTHSRIRKTQATLAFLGTYALMS